MKNKLMTAVGLFGAAALAWAAKDPVLMTVNGIDVPKSEFEYLYHKNSQQQVESQPLEDYVEMFKIYKLKVADALSEGVDTTAEFRKEMAQYRRELAAPYLADSVFLNNLVKEAYDLSRNEAEAIHIMLRKPQGQPSQVVWNRADSLRRAILAGQDFTTVAAEWSQDGASKDKGGNMGFMSAGNLPYNFEKTAFTLPEGEISEVVETPVGYHILKGGRKRPARGTVTVTHILKMVPPTASEAEQTAARAWIDSVANVVANNPMEFERIAMFQSDDKGSARNGGQLPPFGAGMMVAPFDSASFALKDGEVSAPVRTQFGWHLIKRLKGSAPATLEKMKPELLARFNNPQDERYSLIRYNTIDRLSAKHKARVNDALYNEMLAAAQVNGLDSAFYASFETPAYTSQALMTIDKKPVGNTTEFFESVRRTNVPADRAAKMLGEYMNYFKYRKLTEAEQDWLMANEADYRNLVNEYHDGSLLYEVSVRKVWDRASKDTEGLNNYFEANRSNYKWTAPHVKGILVQAPNDSVAAEIRARLSQLGSDTIVTAARKEFGRQASIERVLVEQGANPMVDNLMFGAPAVTPSNSKYSVYFLFDPVVLNEPEEVSDVRGMVTSDYQNQLESDWVEELKARYPVKVNEKVLKKVK